MMVLHVLWLAYWLAAIISGVAAFAVTVSFRSRSESSHLRFSMILQAVMFILIGLNFIAEINWYRPCIMIWPESGR